MTNSEVLKKTKDFVKAKMSGEGTGHDWWHVYRVWKNAKILAKKEKANMFVVELAALLHDIADWKFNNNDLDKSAKVSRCWLNNLKVEDKIIKQVEEIIKGVTFKGAGEKSPLKTVEGWVVQDADRLDALGAIGIARAFAYGGFLKREIYNPEIKAVKHRDFKHYKTSRGTTINHFYEKLLLLKKLMNTKTAKLMAEERHVYMEQFLKRFYSEWRGGK